MALSMLKNLTLFKKLKGGEQDKTPLFKACELIAGLITIAITIMDTGVDYNLNEISFYRHPIVQIIGVFAVAYTTTEGDMMLTLLLCAVWFFIKHRFDFGAFWKQEDPEDAYKTTVKHLLRRLKSKSEIGNTFLN